MNARKQVLVDGYNAIRRTPTLDALFRKDLARSRDALAARCAAWRNARRDIADVLLVFDGAGAPAGAPEASATAGVRACFSRHGETADQLIAALVRESPTPRQVVVVSDDAEVARQARARGAEVLGVRDFLAPPRGRRGAPPPGAGDGKPPPHQQGEINAWLRARRALE